MCPNNIALLNRNTSNHFTNTAKNLGFYVSEKISIYTNVKHAYHKAILNIAQLLPFVIYYLRKPQRHYLLQYFGINYIIVIVYLTVAMYI